MDLDMANINRVALLALDFLESQTTLRSNFWQDNHTTQSAPSDSQSCLPLQEQPSF